MRTTLDIDDEVLAVAKEMARHGNKTIGQVISELVRHALTQPALPAAEEPKSVFGFRPFPNRGAVVTNDLVNRLREDEGI